MYICVYIFNKFTFAVYLVGGQFLPAMENGVKFLIRIMARNSQTNIINQGRTKF